MVTKMTKYSFILFREDTEAFLRQLQEVGVVDITRSKKPVDSRTEAMLENAGAQKRAMALLKKAGYKDDPDLEAIKKAAEDAAGKAASVGKDGVSLSKEIADTAARISSLAEQLGAVNRSAKALLPWGQFDAKAVAGLQKEGLKVRFYCVSRKVWSQDWASVQPLQVVNEDKNNVWFVTVSPVDAEYDFLVAEVPAPEGSYEDALAQAESIRSEIISCKGLLMKLSERAPELQAEYMHQLTELDYALAGISAQSAAEQRLNVLVGYAPTDMESELQEKFDAMGVFYLREDASEEDNPPIKLKNNKFVSMFEVLTGMYGMPAYTEFDPTPVLAPFFLLFFGLCLGDAGYGLVLVILGLYAWKKIKSLQKMAPLVITLGAGTFVIGTFMHTFFGFDMLNWGWIPDWLKGCMLSGKVGNFDAAMVLAIGVGVFNICVSMVMKALCYTHRFGFKATLGTWGWTLLIVGGIILIGVSFLDIVSNEVMKWIFIVLAVVSGLGIYIFNTPGRNPLINVGAGLWDTYNMVTGLLGDTLSFIRLYALGLAGGMLGATFNDLAGMLMNGISVPGLNWLAYGAIFLIGHVLNIALSCLGAFVHPLRLTFVEFFKNSGYEGSGKAYNPLAVKKDE